MLIEFLEEFLKNRKKYFGGICGFLIGLLFVTYGIQKTLIIMVLSIVGYKLGDQTMIKSLKKTIINKLKED